MNQRIKELDKQAWDYVDATWDWTNPDKPSKAALFKTKFAELIVAEMCEVMTAQSNAFDLCNNYGAVQGIDVGVRKVKQHFGVE
jgi:hypothetical protein